MDGKNRHVDAAKRAARLENSSSRASTLKVEKLSPVELLEAAPVIALVAAVVPVVMPKGVGLRLEGDETGLAEPLA